MLKEVEPSKTSAPFSATLKESRGRELLSNWIQAHFSRAAAESSPFWVSRSGLREQAHSKECPVLGLSRAPHHRWLPHKPSGARHYTLLKRSEFKVHGASTAKRTSVLRPFFLSRLRLFPVDASRVQMSMKGIEYVSFVQCSFSKIKEKTKYKVDHKGRGAGDGIRSRDPQISHHSYRL